MYTIRSLSLYNFQEINETGDFTYLLEDKTEKANEQELTERYFEILEQYNALLGDKSTMHKYKLRAEISYCYNKLNNLMGLVQILDMDYEFEEDLQKEIKNCCARYNTEFNYPKLKWSIDGIQNRLNRKLTEYEKYKGSDESESFDTFFIEICKAYGQKVNKKETTVSEWAAIVKSTMKKA